MVLLLTNMETDPIETTQGADPVLSVQKKKGPWILLVLLVIVLAAFAGVFYIVQNSTFALRGLHTLAVGTGDTTLHVFGLKGITDTTFPLEGRVTDFASGGSLQAAIVVNTEGNAQVALAGGEPKTLYTGKGALASLAVSEDGTMLAVAELDPARKGMEAKNIDAWTVHVFTSAGAKIMSTPGYAPHFFREKNTTRLLVTAPGGITLVNLATATGVTEAILDATTTARTATISSNGAYVVIPDATPGEYTLYGVTSYEPLRFAPLWKLAPALSSVAWYRGALYGIAVEGEKSTLVRFQTFGESSGTTVYTFPQASTLYRLVP